MGSFKYQQNSSQGMNYLVLNDMFINRCKLSTFLVNKMTNPEASSKAYALLPHLLPHKPLLSS